MGAHDNAATLIDRAEELLSHSLFESCFIKYIYAYLYFKNGEPEKARTMTRTALEFSRNNGYENWFFSKVRWVPDLVAGAYPPGNPIAQPPAPCVHLPEPLNVYCFGRLRIFVGEHEITKKQWKSKKALEIFKYLILSRSRGYTPKEVLMEFLWPEESPEKTGKRLHVALPSFRKTLEPHLKRGSSYLLREKNAYKIDITRNGFVDVDQFLSDIKSAESCNDTPIKLGYLHAALSLYKGKLFEEDPYAEWCFDEKERLERAYLSAIGKIIEIYESQTAFEKCILYSEKYLESDPFSEDVYRKLMYFYSETGNNPMVIKTYDRCRHHIVSNLNCPLNKHTVALYHRMVSFS
ncbi:MAG: hypothetical protein JEZ12_26870 [Desulfobacterium sp.]|nr:hypothetical protein [Desulfobacterium sp.]